MAPKKKPTPRKPPAKPKASPKGRTKRPAKKNPKARSPTSVMDVLANIKQAEALRLRTQGHNFREIGERLGVSVATAHGYVSAGLVELAELQHAKSAELRALEVARLDALLVKVWPFATGDLSGLIAELKAKREELASLDPKAAKKGALAQILAELTDGVPSDNFLRRALNIIALRGRLLGLEAPIKHAHTNPEGTEERPPGSYVFPVAPGVTVDEWLKLATAAAKAGQG